MKKRRPVNEDRWLDIKSAMVKKKISREELAEMLGISVYALNNKLKDRTEFTIAEADKLCKILSISNPEKIFLPTWLHSMQQNAERREC